MRGFHRELKWLFLLLLSALCSQEIISKSITPELIRSKSIDSHPWLGGIKTQLTFLSKTRNSHDSHIYTFELPEAKDENNQTYPINLGIDICSCLLVSSPRNSTLVRPYTPVSNRHQLGSFSLLVKKYPNGAMGNEFEKLKPGDSMTFWQIPFNKKIQYPFQNPNTILMLSAGTGITPMYQALDRMFGLEEQKQKENQEGKIDKGMKENNHTRVILLYASRTKKDIYFRKELDDMKKRNPERLEIIHVISDKYGDIKKSSYSKSKFPCMMKGRINKILIRDIFEKNGIKCHGSRNETIQIWVCGPPSFYSDLCGPRDDKNISGVLKDLDFQSNEVIKF